MTVIPASVPRPVEQAPLGGEARRLLYLDNLKIVLIAGVIACHATLIYGPGTGWLSYHEGQPGPLETILLGIPGLLGGLFWLGLFFLVSGMLVPKSLQKKGTVEFIRERFVHLLPPLIVYTVVVMPALKYAVARDIGRTTEPPWQWIPAHIWPLDAGPLWFVAALLIFSTGYAFYDRAWRARPRSEVVLRARSLALLALAIAVLSFLFRLVWPMDGYQFLNLHLWQWPQYVLLFWAGAWSAERGWPRLSDSLWRKLGLAILGAAAIGAAIVLAAYYGILPRAPGLYAGGWRWEALFAPAVEGVLAVCGSLWLVGAFRRRVDFMLPFGKQLMRGYYGAYVIQAVVVMALALLLRPLPMASELKFVIVAPLGIAGSFALAWYVVRLPGINRVL